uniref:Jacalin-type lectin domain-containing protein n=1 Tax=Ananas comosus var. bracteatus TaxID=296719 RepID=A0A6V7NMN8_ANACO|nr:unnamed protein product [Ananas comosus var. bracteatus]
MVHKEGPWGGTGGTPFDTKAAQQILGFEVWYDDCVTGIRFKYQQDDEIKWSKVFGSTSGGRHDKVQTTNTITGIHGTESTEVVQSLSFVTSAGTYGPYGSKHGNPFDATGVIVGFFGRSSEQLDAIGVWIDP